MRSVLISLSIILTFFIFTPIVHAQSGWSGACVAEGDVATLQGFECLFGNILSIVLKLLGLAMFVMFLVGGFKIMTAGGDAKAMEAGKQTITLAIGGLVLAIFVWFILVFLSTITGIDFTTFTIPIPQ